MEKVEPFALCLAAVDIALKVALVFSSLFPLPVLPLWPGGWLSGSTTGPMEIWSNPEVVKREDVADEIEICRRKGAPAHNSACRRVFF